jgi:hypothetical protein
MKFNDHSRLAGTHAFCSASQYHWINYSDEKLIERYNTAEAAQRGTQLHEFAATCINLKQRLPRSNKTLNLYVNDAIGFHMEPEVVLYYSDNFYGTADSISFRDNFLRIHDLKTGDIPAHMEQLEIYTAFFCLEYNKNPNDLEVELRLYQSNEVKILHSGEPFIKADDSEHELITDVLYIMDKIKRFDSMLKELQEGS